VPPLTLNFVRWVLAALLLAPLGWQALRDMRVIAAAWPYLLAVGCLGVGAYNAFQYVALTTSTPLNVTLIAASSPLWMLAVGALLFGQPTAPRQVVGALLSLAGVMLVQRLRRRAV
jgi:drug/metabolite transporter (DMT)-like permease